MPEFQFAIVAPAATLVAFGLLLLLFSPGMRGLGRVMGLIAAVGTLVSGYSTWVLWRAWQAAGPLETAYGMVRVDGFGLFATALLLGITLLSLVASFRFLEREDADQGEFYPLILLAAAGMVMMVHTTHLVMVLVGLEVFSIPLYILSGLTRGRPRSVESSLKYFLMGAFSSGFFVYGMALLYGASGSLDLVQIAKAASLQPSPMLWLGMGLVFVGLAFKIAVVPFHHWVPDVYQGAPTNVTGFMAAATKTAAFVALLRVMLGAFGGQRDEVWLPLVTVLAILTMTVGNLVALAQNNIKRLLAFSSIGHAGYLMITLVCTPDLGVRALLVYLTAYALMTVGAFAVAAAVGRGDAQAERGYDIWSWSGLGWSRPGLGIAMTVFLLSLAGIPPTAGFIGKYVVFTAAVESHRYLLAVVMALNAAVGAYYYLRVIVALWMREPEEGELPEPVSPWTAAVLVVAVAGTLYLGVLPGSVLDAARGLASTLI